MGICGCYESNFRRVLETVSFFGSEQRSLRWTALKALESSDKQPDGAICIYFRRACRRSIKTILNTNSGLLSKLLWGPRAETVSNVFTRCKGRKSLLKAVCCSKGMDVRCNQIISCYDSIWCEALLPLLFFYCSYPFGDVIPCSSTPVKAGRKK